MYSSVTLPPQYQSQAIVCVSTLRMYPLKGYFQVIDIFGLTIASFSAPLIMVATGSGTDEVQIVDIANATNKCSNLPSYPYELIGGAGKIINGSPLICGGYSLSSGYKSSCYSYDKQLSHWTLFADMKVE